MQNFLFCLSQAAGPHEALEPIQSIGTQAMKGAEMVPLAQSE